MKCILTQTELNFLRDHAEVPGQAWIPIWIRRCCLPPGLHDGFISWTHALTFTQSCFVKGNINWILNDIDTFTPCLAISWRCHESHSWFWTKCNFRDCETGSEGPFLLSIMTAPKLIWGTHPGNFWSLVVAAVFWNSGWCSKRPYGRIVGLFHGQKLIRKEVRLSCLQ